MKAQEARRLALSTELSFPDTDIYRLINSHISRAAKNGKLTINHQGIISEKVSKKLQSEGFKVETVYDHRDGDFTKITW